MAPVWLLQQIVTKKNRPGGHKLWKSLEKLDVEDLTDDSGIAAMGNAEEILRDVRDNGLFLTASRPA